MSALLNIDFSTGNVSLSDTNEGGYSSHILNHYGDLMVGNNGRVEGVYTLDLESDLPIREREVASSVQVPSFLTHRPVIRTVSSIPTIDIVIAGVGGTGAYVVRDLCRFVYSLQAKGHSIKVKIHLFDPDIVEEKNLNRQNYIPKDLGQFKAEVSAKRYGTAFGVDITAYPVALTQRKLQDLQLQGTILIVGCIDNNKARREIYEFSRRASHCYWIDSGNERASGQVVCGYKGITRYGLEDIDLIQDNTQFSMPFVTEIYKEILDSSMDNVGDDNTSCAERSITEDQNIFVNMTAAVNVLNFIRQIVLQEPMIIGSLEFNIKGLNKVNYLNPEYFKEIITNFHN